MLGGGLPPLALVLGALGRELDPLDLHVPIRRHAHRREVLDALIADLHRIGPDHTVITGDLTHIGLARELQEVAAWLPELGGPAEVFVVPGNHDAYAAEPWSRTFALWEPSLAGDDTHGPAPANALPPTYLGVRLRRGVALVGVNHGHLHLGDFFTSS